MTQLRIADRTNSLSTMLTGLRGESEAEPVSGCDAESGVAARLRLRLGPP